MLYRKSSNPNTKQVMLKKRERQCMKSNQTINLTHSRKYIFLITPILEMGQNFVLF